MRDKTFPAKHAANLNFLTETVANLQAGQPISFESMHPWNDITSFKACIRKANELFGQEAYFNQLLKNLNSLRFHYTKVRITITMHTDQTKAETPSADTNFDPTSFSL